MRAISSSDDLRFGSTLRDRIWNSPWLWYGAFLTLYAVFFGLWPAQPLSFEIFAANVLLIAVCCFPLTLWKARGSRGLPLFELICLAYGVGFGLVGHLVPNSITILSQHIRLDDNSLLQATALAALGVTGLIVGYEATRRLLAGRGIVTLDLPLDPRRSLVYMAIAPLLSAVFLLLPFEGGQFGALIGLITGQLYLALVLLAFRFYDPAQKTPLIKWLFYFALSVAVLLGFAAGFLERAAVPFVLVIVVRWYLTKRFPLRLVVPLALLFVLLNFVKGDYRQQAWYGGQSGLGSRVTLWWDLAVERAGTLTSGEEQSNAGQSADGAGDVLWKRFDLLHKFVWVLKKTPSDVPHYEGATYSYLLYGWIPRFVWPDKPSASEGAAYRVDLDYQFITEESIGKTNIGIGFLPEAFANFGAWGVFFVMALQGACFAFLSRLLNGPYSQGGRAIFLAVMIFFLNGIGSSTVTLFGALLQIVLANAVILRFFATGWRATPPRN